MATSAGNIPISATFAAAQLEKDVLSALNRIQSKSNLSLNTRNFSQPLGKITGLANEFQKSLEASNARVVAFGASAGLIFAVQKSFSSLVNTTIEVEKSLTDINVVLNTSSKGIKQFGDQLFSVAKNTGSAFKDVASAATEFSRQGLGLEETLKRTRDALILTRLSGLDVVSSTEALTAAVNSFTKEALTTTDVVNKLAAVDAKFAVSSRDLSEAIQRVGSSASEAGVSFDELLGIVTSVQQTTARGGAVIGNALKTIFTRIERPQVISDLKDFGIAVTDISGNALPTIKVIENLAQSFQNLNPVIKSQVAELVGGVYQINILKAALADVSKQNSAFAEATRTSSKAADEAILKNKALNESLSALLNETTINFTKFATSIGEASVGPGIRKVLGYINSSLESYNEKDAEGVGEKIATGVLSGVTNFITGPGLGIGAFAIGKLLANFTKFAGDATKNLLGLNTLGRQQAVLQSEIGKILSDNPDLIKDIISGSRTRLQVEQQIKQTLIEQAALAEQIKNSSIDIGGRFLASGLRVSEKNTIVGRRSAEGYIPAKQQAAEMVGAMQGGYTPGRVVAAPKSIGGIMNTAETVKYIPGFAQPYILPPQGSRAATQLASKSMAKNGINPYMAKGFIPNFAPKPLTNPSYGDNDWWLGSGLSAPVSLSQITTGTSAAWSQDKGFYKTDGSAFTANDLNTFVRRGATYGDIRKYVPDSLLKDDPRWKSGAISDLNAIRRDFAPGKKIAGQENIKEGIKQVYDPYVPPASMLVFDLDAKNKELFADEKTEEILTKRKEDGRAFKIKSYALNSSSQNEEKTNLITQTADFSRRTTKQIANYIRPGEYSDASVDEFFNKAGKNYSVLAGTIFEASTNLAANYTRDQSGGGVGDFDVIGGNIGNVRQFFPGFGDQYGDYKLRNNDDAVRSFIGKVKKKFGLQMAEHFKAQEKKVSQLSTGFSKGFIPNFAQKDFQTVNTARLMGINLAQMDINPETVFRESLQNAVAHGQSGQEKGVFIGVSGYGKPNEFAISDVGTGMSPEDVFTKFLPYAQTGNEGGNKGLSGFGMGKASIFMGSKKFLLDTIKEINGRKIRTIVSGTPEGWNNFIQKGKISLDETLFNQPRGDLNFDGLKMFWREVNPEKKNTPIMGTTFAASPSKEGYISYGSYLENRAGKVAELPFKFTTASSGLLRQTINTRNEDPSYRKYYFSKFDPSKSSVQRTLTAEGGEVDILFDPQGDPQKTYGYAQIPMLSEGMKYANYKVEGVDYIPKSLMFNVRSNVGAGDPNYPWNTDRTELRGPLGKMAKSAVQDLAAQLKRAQEDSVRNVPSYQMGSDLELLDVSSSLPKGTMESIAGNPKFQNFGAALKSVFEQTIGQASEIFDPRMANASFRGLAVGANWMGLNTASSKEVGTKSIVEPFAHVETVIDRIRKISQEKAKQGKKIKSVGKFRDIYSREILDTVFHEAAHQVNRTEGEAHAKSMASVWAANAEQVGSYLKEIQGSLTPELMNFIISTYKQNKSIIDEGKASKFRDFVSNYSSGHIPNFARMQLGKPGFFGTFSALRGNLGVKQFPDNESSTKSNVANEYLASQELGQMIDAEQLNPIFETPKIYGALSKAIQKSAIYKEIFSGKTAQEISENLDEYTGERRGFVQLAEIIADRATSQINAGGRMEAVDLTQNLGNMMYNQVAEGILSKISRRNYEKLLKSIESKDNKDAEAQIDRILSSIFTKGGKVSIVDTGMFNLGSGLASKRKSSLGSLGYEDDFRFASGYIPNFNPVMEAMNREMSAGYSASQVRLGRSDKLKTSFNPMGLGVYNSTEGSLNNGIGLAEKAGIDPKTKGMSARGHIPNFAEFGGADAFILIAAFGTLSTALKEVAGSLRTLKGSSDTLIKSNASAAASYSQQIGQIPKDFKKSQKAISDEIERTFTNVNKTTLKLQGTATGPLVGKTTRDQFGIVTSSPVAASPEQVARLEELRKQQSELRKKAREELSAAREGRRQAQENIRQAQAPVFSRASFASGGQADRYVRGLGTQIGLIGSVASNIGGQFISPENKTGRAAASGLGDIASFAGLGAQFGPYGAIAGVILGAGSALIKLKDAKAEEAIDKINKSLGETKERSAEFSGAAQNYSTSLEGLQNALNDPKTKPEALLKFQNNLTEALNSIPEQFRSKVLAAGTEISKVTEAIGEVNKEMANTQKNLERQLAITQFIEKQSSFLGRSSLKPKDQEVFNRLFTSSIRSEDITKKFTGENAAADFSKFIDSLKSQAIIYSQETIGPYGSRIGAQPMVNKESVENIKAQLKQNTVIPEEIIDQLDKAFAEFDTVALSSLFDSLKKAGIDVFDFAKRSKNLGEILAENTKRLKENEEVLKSLNSQYNSINLQISNQIDIEKNRAQTIREINKIQAEGAVSIQRARVKGLLESATPFISESSKSDIQNQLDLNEITSRQNSKIQEASNKLLDSFSNTIIKKSEEARSKVIPAIEGAKSENAIQQERAVFQNQIQKLTPLIAESLKQINSGGNIGDIQTNLINNIRGFSQFKPEERDVLVQTLEVSFGEFQNTLAEIKAQGDIDIQIQEAQREYQKQSLELNQRLSFAGGAQALSSTGKAGVSELFDNISELVSEFRQTNVAGNAAQRGSSAFKLLDVLTNQLQLNRSIGQPSGFIGPSASGSAFNNQVSSDLNPLVGTAIAGRVQQIRESVDLARRVTEIQMGKPTAGTALGTAFDQAKEGAVKTALDQITSQFKLENMGNYLDVLQQEARFLNDLTQDQNSILEKTLPTTINENFNRVITEQVGSKLDSLTTSLQGVINKLGVATKRNALESEMFNKLPADVSPADRQAILNRIAASQNLRDTEGSISMQTNNAEAGIRLAREKEIKKLQDYFKSFDLVTVTGAEGAFTEAYKNLIGDPSKVSRDDYGNITGGVSYGKGYYGTGTSRETINNAVVLQEDLGSSYEDQLRNQKRLEQLIASREKSIGRPEINLSGTYKGLTQDINRDFKVSMAEETVKSIKSAQEELRRLDSASPLMSVGNKSTAPSLQDIIDKYGLADQGGAKRNLPTQLAQGRANLDSINNLLLARLENDKQLVDLNEKVNNLLKEDLNDTKKREDLIKLQTELRKKTLEQEGKVAEELYNLYYKGSFGETFFKDERAAFANARIENEARQGRVAIGAITEKNTTYNRADFARDTGQLIDTFQTDFKSGIASAFGEAIKGTKTLKDAFRDMFQGILNRMLDKSLEMGVDALFAFGKAATGRKDGGLIRGYNSGGMVVGGSGMKDDVPAMMSGGEYVIKKSSVKKYGSDYLRALNGGLVPKYAVGGFSMGPLQNEFLYDNPDRPTSGEFAVDSRLSAAALTDENNPQNRLRQDRYEKLDQYLQDRSQYEKDKQQAIKNYKNQVNSTFYSGLTAAAVQLGAAGLTVGAANMRTNAATSAARGLEPGGNLTQAQLNAQYARNLRSNGGYIARFAGGGSTGKDNIPALLMGGEYVMNKKAVDMYGRDFMNQLNTGTLPKYASGGMVGTSYTAGQNTPESSVTELVAALNTLNENLSKGNDITQAESGKISAAGANQESGMSVVNNISINVAQSGEVTSEANATTQNGGSNTNKDQNNIQNNAKLAELLRSKVVEVLVEQKRPGGLLYASR
jgi:TP901 family phage tail tape measure protein